MQRITELLQNASLHMWIKQLHTADQFKFLSQSVWILLTTSSALFFSGLGPLRSLSKLKSKSLFWKPAVLVQKSFTPWGVNSTLAETPPLHTHTVDWCVTAWGWRRLLWSLYKWRGRSVFFTMEFLEGNQNSCAWTIQGCGGKNRPLLLRCCVYIKESG